MAGQFVSDAFFSYLCDHLPGGLESAIDWHVLSLAHIGTHPRAQPDCLYDDWQNSGTEAELATAPEGLSTYTALPSSHSMAQNKRQVKYDDEFYMPTWLGTVCWSNATEDISMIALFK